MHPGQLLRLNFESDLSLPLDDYNSIQSLVSRADKIFTYEAENIRIFFTSLI